jgi:PrtD family type I secretion system ABC transporter
MTSLVGGAVGLHVTAMVLGMGAAAVADALGAGILVGNIRPPQRMFRLLHHAIFLAIVALVFSGGVLIVMRSGGWCDLDADRIVRLGATCIPNKVVVKLTLMTVLAAVALLIDAYLLPISRRAERPLLPHLRNGDIVRISAIATASFTCWCSIATVALAKPLHTWPVLGLLAVCIGVWLTLTLIAGAALFALRQLMWQGRLVIGRKQPAIANRLREALSTQRDGLIRVPSPEGRSVLARQPSELGPVTVSDAIAVCKKALIGTAVISMMINVLMLAGPLYMLQVYDRVLTSRNVETLVVLTALLVSTYSFMGFLEIVRGRILGRLALRLDRMLGARLFTSYVANDDPKREGDPHQPLRDLEQIRQFVSGSAPTAFFDLPWAPIFLALIFLLHPLLGIVATVGAAVLVVLSISTQVLTRRPLEKAANEAAATHALVESGRRNSETLRSMAMVGRHRDRWLADHQIALSRQLKAGDVTGGLAAVTRICRLLLQSLLLGTGAYLAVNDAMSPGAMIAASIVATRALAPIEQLIGQWRSVLGYLSALRRCRANLQKMGPDQTYLTLPDPSGHLEVSQLYVALHGRAEPVIKGLNFQLQPGDALAVLGPSAAGKSTLARALVGLRTARHGEIRLDGAALSQWDPDQLGRHIGYLPQDVTLMQGTVAENIARFDPNPDPQAVIAAAIAANVHETILRMEKGYQTQVGDEGAALSGGQRQRIGLARALYGNPALIVLDEPNANLDAAGEDALAKAIKTARAAKRTLIVMAHRQSILRCVNRVLVLNEGRQVAFDEINAFLQKIQRRPERRHANSASSHKAKAAS